MWCKGGGASDTVAVGKGGCSQTRQRVRKGGVGSWGEAYATRGEEQVVVIERGIVRGQNEAQAVGVIHSRIRSARPIGSQFHMLSTTLAPLCRWRRFADPNVSHMPHAIGIFTLDVALDLENTSVPAIWCHTSKSPLSNQRPPTIFDPLLAPHPFA